MNIVRYSSVFKNDWNNFVQNSNNATFLFYRDYMDYHTDRFVDHSLLVFDDANKNIIAVFPANEYSSVLYSHQGLTYGGLVSSNSYTFQTIEAFNAINIYCQKHDIHTINYKPLPYIYASYPAQNDLYCLFRLDAKLNRREISTVIPKEGKMRLSSLRKRGAKKAEAAGLKFSESDRVAEFWEILSNNLQKKYRTLPTHSLQEINYLREKFPQNIRLFTICDGCQIIAGVVIYDTGTVAHVQYISSTEEGQAKGALDYLFVKLINEVYATKPYFDFGTSNESSGLVLNDKLIFQKEGFGGRGVVYESYQYSTKNLINI